MKYLEAIKKGNFIMAIGLINQELAKNPEDPELLYNLAICCSRTDNHKKAVSVLEQLLEKYPRFIEKENIYRILIYSLIKMNEFERAVELTDLRLKMNIADKKLLSFKAYLFEKMGKTEDAIKIHRILLNNNPENTNSKNSLAFLLVNGREPSENELEEAERLIADAMAVNEDNPAYLHTLAVILKKVGKPDDARSALEKAASLAPGEDVILRDLRALL